MQWVILRASKTVSQELFHLMLDKHILGVGGYTKWTLIIRDLSGGIDSDIPGFYPFLLILKNMSLLHLGDFDAVRLQSPPLAHYSMMKPVLSLPC